MVLVVLFPLEDEKNVDVNQLFSGRNAKRAGSTHQVQSRTTADPLS